MNNNIHVDDIGTLFKALILSDLDNTPLDISQAVTKILIFKPPLRDSFERTATFTTDGTDGRLEYSTISGDLSIDGEWEIQAKVTAPTYNNSSEIKTFSVIENL